VFQIFLWERSSSLDLLTAFRSMNRGWKAAPTYELASQFKMRLLSACHAGLDPWFDKLTTNQVRNDNTEIYEIYFKRSQHK